MSEASTPKSGPSEQPTAPYLDAVVAYGFRGPGRFHVPGHKGGPGLPPDALTMALIPMGYPASGRWAQPRRRPVEDVVHWNHWGAKHARPE